jgi:hypothetical protein
MDMENRLRMLDEVRNRILRQQEEDRILGLLGGYPFAISMPDGRLVDPFALRGEEMMKAAWMEQMRETFGDFADRRRVADFVKEWAGLDQDHRHELIDENANLFKPARVRWLKSLTDSECEYLQECESWEVFGHLSGRHDPIHGVREIWQTEQEFHTEGESMSPAPTLSMAA